MLEKYFEDINTLFPPNGRRKRKDEKDAGFPHTVTARFQDSDYKKIEKIAELEGRDFSAIVRAFTLYCLNKIKID